MQTLNQKGTFDQFIKEKRSFLVFKHSPTCSISNRACGVVLSLLESIDSDLIYKIDVLADREISQYIAKITNIAHESPQVILFIDGIGVEDVSHYEITQELLEDRVGKIS